MSKTTISLPIVDMTKTKTNRSEMAKLVVNALENIGFLFIDNIDGLDIDMLLRCCKWFFSLPWETRKKVCRKQWVRENSNLYRGYFPIVDGEVSRKEGFECGRDVDPEDQSIDPTNWFYEKCSWPEEDGSFPFKEFMTNTYELLHNLSMEILRLAALGVGADEETFTHLFVNNPCSTLRISHYRSWNGIPPEKARLENGKLLTTPEHTDTNFLTLLAIFNNPGLEIVNKEGKWVGVEMRPNSLVMNIGDVFEKVTGKRFKATRHRVVDIGTDRYSVPFFLEPSYHSDVAGNLMNDDDEHIPESYGHYMMRFAKYESITQLDYLGFMYSSLPDFDNVGKKLGRVSENV